MGIFYPYTGPRCAVHLLPSSSPSELVLCELEPRARRCLGPEVRAALRMHALRARLRNVSD
jgi:hypothetical protein